MKDQRFGLVLEQAERAKLAELARQVGQSESSVVRELIQKAAVQTKAVLVFQEPKDQGGELTRD